MATVAGAPPPTPAAAGAAAATPVDPPEQQARPGTRAGEREGADRSRPSAALLVASLVVALVFAGPLGYLVVRNAGLGADLGTVLSGPDVRGPLGRTLLLAAAVSAAAAVVGTGLAWLTSRTDLPARRLWQVLAPLPLVIPSFVGAAALIAAFAPNGFVDQLLPVGRLPRVRGFGAAWLVLTLFTYPYVYLPVAARLRGLPPSLEESARLLGRRPAGVFTSVVVPQVAGATWAGTLLVFLYTVSDFGAVQLLRYDTLTRAIEASKLSDRSLTLGLVLAVVAVAVVALERAVRRRAAALPAAPGRRALQVPLGRWRWPALAAVAVVVGNALVGPLLVLGWWAVRGEGRDVRDLVEPALSTSLVSAGTAVVAVAVVLPVAYLVARYRTRAGDVANAMVVGGFALPGLVTALALTYWVLQAPVAIADALYQTLPVLVGAYVLHFGAQAMRAASVAVAAVPPRLDDAARVLGAGRARRFLTVELPLMRPGLLAGAGLVLLSTMKELPATLLLAPTWFRTLATTVWADVENGFLARAAQASLVLVAVSGVLTWLLVLRRSEAPA